MKNVPEITSRTIYEIEYDGDVHEFDDYNDAWNFQHNIETAERIKFMDSINIPKKGMCLIHLHKLMCSGETKSLLMFNRKCVATFHRRSDGKLFYGQCTHWNERKHCGFVDFDDINHNRREYEQIWNSKFDEWHGAYHEYWGTPDDGMTTFDCDMSWNDDEGFDIEIL